MQIFNKQFLLTSSECSMEMESSAYLHFDSSVSVLPSVIDSHFMSPEASSLQSHELRTYALWATDLPQSTPYELRVCTSDAMSAEDNVISISGLTVRNVPDFISFFEDCDIVRSTDMHFSIATSADLDLDDCGLVIDTERAVAFWITIIGMEFPADSSMKFENAMPRRGLRRSREHLSSGRMICLLKQQLNL